MLHGKPGTGKTFLFEVLADELQLPSFVFTASFFSDKYIGESSRRIHAAFESAQALNKPALIFIDEIDALACKRNDNTHNEHRATLITLLTELQNLQKNPNLYILVATNDIKSLDPAIKDRFAGQICEIKELALEQKAQLFQRAFAKKGINLDWDFCIKLANVIKKDFSNRDIENIVTTTHLKWWANYVKDPKNYERSICPYLKQALDATDKDKNYPWVFASYCGTI